MGQNSDGGVRRDTEVNGGRAKGRKDGQERRVQLKEVSGFSSALSGRKSRRELEHLNLEVANLNSQIRSL